MSYPNWTINENVHVNCLDCTAECCKHVAIEIDAPEDWEDYQHLADYLQYKNITVYQDHDDDWMVEFKTRCGQLEGNRCKSFITDTQPMTCREYSIETCVMNQPGDYWQVFFHTPEQVAEYAASQGITKPIVTTKENVCNDECCNHVSIPLDEPEEWRDYDDIRWYVAHRDVQVYKDDDGDWMCRFNTSLRAPCARCTQENCEFDSEDFARLLSSMEDVDAFLAEEKIERPPATLQLTEY